ncbi:MAG: putative peptidase [Chlamydiae bacterium]|nr:putative peptidase [Chlamydiota bacterium]
MSKKRIERVQNRLKEENVDWLYIDDPTDLFYLTGKEVSTGKLFLSPKEAFFFIDGRYFEECQEIDFLSLHLLSTLPELLPLQGKTIGFGAQNTLYSTFQELKEKGAELIPVDPLLQNIRQIKEPEEQDLLRESAALGSSGYDYLLSILEEGITEKEVARKLEIFWLESGGEGLAFSPIVSFGADTSKPHYHPQEKPLQKAGLILLDIGVVLNHYHSDMTRVVTLGTPTNEMEKVYEIVREAQRKALALCCPGTPIQNLEKAVRSWIERNGYGEYFPHSLGHGIGLKTHESPFFRKSDLLLEEGMVITIEPGIYLPKVGGVRLEDTVLITKTGYENLTNRPIPPSLLCL